MTPTGRQIREGRTLAGMSQGDLAAGANVAIGLLVRVEASDGLPMITRRDSIAITAALEGAGVEFISGNRNTASVQMRRREP